MNYKNKLEYKPGRKKINNRMLKNILKITEDKKKICNKDFIKLGKKDYWILNSRTIKFLNQKHEDFSHNH